MTSSPANQASHAPTASTRSTASALVGNFMEYFDFAAYGFLAATLGATFFPTGNPTTQLLSSFAAFGVAFLLRPLGGAVFGFVGDRYGRKAMLVSSILLMTFATGLIGVLPTYATAGVAAPMLLVLMRCLQGLSVGGEFSGSSTFVVEYAGAGRRGLAASFISATSALGTIAGSLLTLLLTSTLPADDMSAWGWRVPFLAAFPLGAIGLYMRFRLEETPVFTEMKSAHASVANPFSTLRGPELVNILIIAAVSGATGLGFYYYSTYLNTYLSSSAGFERAQAITLSTVSLIVYACLCPLAGWLSDRHGRKRPFVAGFLTLGVLVVPIFMLLNSGFVAALIGLLLYGLPMSLINVILSPVMAEMFPAHTRATAGSIGHEIGLGFISGTGPFIATALIAATGSPLAPAYYLATILIAAGILAVFVLPETSRRSLLTATVREAAGLSPTST